ncbi:DMT family transporter [Novosphingobium bradum]|uniref:DMT family transporter n=1 Tax=Novosphingobium bradum TaxID=1737444 RepID=A0ABV7IU85_9SPHN
MHRQNRPFLALGLRLMAMVMLSALLLLVKLAGERGIALPETMFWRQFIPGCLILAWLGARGELARLKTGRFLVHARRALIGTCGMFLTLGVVLILPLAEATVLSFTTPIFAVLLATLFLGEHVGPWRWGAVLLGLLGVVVIAGPDRGHLPLLGVAAGLGAAFFVALVSIQLRDLGRTEEPIRIVFYFSALGALMLLPGLVLRGSSHDAMSWLLIGGIGLSGLFAQLLMTAALRFGTVSSVIVMDYSQLVWATLWGWLFFAQLPPATTWLGAPFVVVAGLVIAWREQVLHRQPAIDPQTAPNAD